MLRRLLNLSILFASLLFAGVPAMACADGLPMHGCCPSAPAVPCHGGTPNAPQGMPTDLACCASGLWNTSAITTAAASPQIEKHAERADPPPAITVFSLPTIADARSSSLLRLSALSRTPSYSMLYLSTGRLRL
jgi:hypothetical protein